jgi:hypothetical protein
MPKSPHREVATTAIHGPDGQRVDVDEQLPGEWSRAYVDSLVADKAARLPRAAAARKRLAPAKTVAAKATVSRTRAAKAGTR